MTVGAVLEPMHRDDRLFIAVACSIVLHLALLYLLPALLESNRKAAPEPPKLTARIVEQKPAVAPKLEEPTLAPPKPAPKAVRPAAPKPVPRTVAPVTPPVIAVPPSPSAPPAAAVPAPAVAPPAPPVAAAPSAPARTGPDAGSVKLYQANLAMVADGLKRYPRVAVDNNWTGSASLRIVVGANGAISSMAVSKSAGYAPLDDEAQRMFRAALEKLPVPPELRGWEFTLYLRADFFFKE